MKFSLFLFGLAACFADSPIKAKYVETHCFWFFTCIKEHQSTVLTEINKVNYISHTTIDHRGYVISTIFYRN